MNELIDARLHELKCFISESQNIDPQHIRMTWRKLLNEFPNQTQYISDKMGELCKKYGIDFFDEERCTGEEIADYVENNVPSAEPLNE